nr:hypothetical protein OH820_27900 [Streptomyces sp. NBC_00857]
MFVNSIDFPYERPIVATGDSTMKLRAPAGAYGIAAIISRYGPDSYWFASDHVLAGEPFLRVTGATEITLGGTAARKLGNTVDNQNVERIFQDAGIRQRQTTVPDGQAQPTSTEISVRYNHRPPTYWAVPSTTRTDASTYTTFHREDLAEGYQFDEHAGDGYSYPTATGPVYYLGGVREGGIPADLTGRISDSALARTEAHYGAAEQAGAHDRPFPLKSKLAAAALKGIGSSGRRVDGGTTGKRVRVVKNRALIAHPDLATLPAEHVDRNGHGYVSLRVKGADRVSSFEVTVRKAYRLKAS